MGMIRDEVPPIALVFGLVTAGGAAGLLIVRGLLWIYNHPEARSDQALMVITVAGLIVACCGLLAMPRDRARP